MSQETIDFVEDIVKTILSRWEIASQLVENC